jgi:hypothetical protein
MKCRPLAVTLLSLAAIASAPASAQTMRPGLWEVNNKMGNQSDPRMQEMAKMQKQQMAEMRKQMAQMPPEQRKQMEDMMNKLTAGAQITENGGMTMKVCVTPEMASQNRMMEDKRGNCTNKRTPPIGGTMKVSYVCTKPASTGEGTVTFSSTAYAMDMTMHITEGGKNMTTSMASTGKWLAASCGDVKPPVIPKEYQ